MPEYRTPGVYIEEISAGPRPVQASPTTETGFVGILTLPTSFSPGRGGANGMFLPAVEETPLLAWNRAVAFRALLPPPKDLPAAAPAADPKGKDKKDTPAAAPAPAGGNRFVSLLGELLPGKWSVAPPNGENVVTLTSEKGETLRVPMRRTMVNVKVAESGAREWELSFGADEQEVLELVASYAVPMGIGHTGSLEAADPKAKPAKIDVSGIQERLQGPASTVQSLDGLELWRRDFGARLFQQIVLEADPNMTPEKAAMAWESLAPRGKAAWDKWIRHHPGMHRLELAISGFFQNGGKTAFVAMGVQAHGAAGPDKRKLLADAFEGISATSMLAAPGLEFAWQQAILEYAGPRGRGDMFAILETPRYMLTREPRGTKLNDFRWSEGASPYEMAVLQAIPSPKSTELRFPGYSADELLDRAVPRDDTGYGAAYGPWLVVDNPLSTGPHDRYVIAPPSGHVAGVVAATDLKAGGGVHKAPANEQLVGAAELVTHISDVEQEALNTKGINIIRQRPGAGIRVWGARTIAADPLWTYINVRRTFLFVERSVRDAIQWAVFLPNNDSTRADLKSTIAAFLYRLWMQGMLDGRTWSEAFSVRCDRENNPDVDVRSGLMTVDVELRPVYPAEFIRIRFRQSPMQSEVTEA
ncbi:MAG: phage tail sheath C-terminal domain-containing protein [Pseudomonadota bacterium]